MSLSWVSADALRFGTYDVDAGCTGIDVDISNVPGRLWHRGWLTYAFRKDGRLVPVGRQPFVFSPLTARTSADHTRVRIVTKVPACDRPLAAVPHFSTHRVWPWLCMAGAICLGTWFGMTQWQAQIDAFYDHAAKEGVQADKDITEVDEDQMAISVPTEVDVEYGSSSIPMLIENPSANKVDQVVTIYETGHPSRVLYKSGALKPGQHLDSVTFDRQLDPGTHSVTISVQGYEDDVTIGEGGQLAGHVAFGVPSETECLLVVTDGS